MAKAEQGPVLDHDGKIKLPGDDPQKNEKKPKAPIEHHETADEAWDRMTGGDGSKERLVALATETRQRYDSDIATDAGGDKGETGYEGDETPKEKWERMKTEFNQIANTLEKKLNDEYRTACKKNSRGEYSQEKFKDLYYELYYGIQNLVTDYVNPMLEIYRANKHEISLDEYNTIKKRREELNTLMNDIGEKYN